MTRRSMVFGIVISMLITMAAYADTRMQNPNGTKKNEKKITVVVSFNAMKEFSEAVGGNKVKIITMIPNGTEPHDFEPKSRDLMTLSKADVFVCSGFGMEAAWKDRAVHAAQNKKLVVVDASKGSRPLAALNIKEGQYDPHIWLSLKGAEYEAKSIENALVKADPQNKTYYESNYANFYNKLESLYNLYAAKLKNVKNKSFVTGHAAFAYLCRDFGLKQNSVEDVFAEGEPSARKLMELVGYCKKNRITTIFAEDMASPKVSKTLASEVGAKVETIYTIESEEDHMDYLQRMKSNLQKIYDSLQ